MPSKPKRGKGAKKRLAARKQIQQSHQEQDERRRILVDRILPHSAIDGPLSEDDLEGIAERIPDWPRSRHEQAQWIMDDVWDDPDDPDEISNERLLRTALALSPDNSDAWLFLAERARSDSDALECCDYAIENERRTLGERFHQLVGNFWLAHETRPFVHAMHTKADILDRMGRDEEAIAAFEELLSLNPHDNQGIRYRLVGLYLLHRREAEAGAILDSYPDEGGCVWPYARFILAFRNRDDDATLVELFNNAFESNQWMLSYLTGTLPVPDGPPQFYQLGEKSEAETMLMDLMPAWTATPGMAAWIRKTISANQIKLPQHESAPSIQQRAMDAELVPLDKDIVWEVDYRKELIKDEVVYALHIVSREQDVVPGNDFFEKAPKPAEVFEAILTAITEPEDGNIALRPGTIVFGGKTLARNLKKRLERIGIRSEHGPTPAVDQFAEFSRSMFGSDERFDALDPVEIEQFSKLVWQVGALELPTQIESEGSIVRPYIVLVVDRESEFIFSFDLVTEIPDQDAILEVIRKAIFSSPAGKPMRPELIQFSSADQMLSVRDTLNEWGIPCEVAKSLKALDTATREMRSQFGDDESPIAPLTETPDVQISDLENFYKAADDYFVAAPWLKTPGDQQFLLTSLADGAEYYLSVMGQMGSLLGLSIYTSVVDLRNMFAGNFNTSRNEGSIWSVSFDEQHLLPQADIRLIEDQSWKISAPEAFPTILSARDGVPESITSRDDLLQITLCIAAINSATLPITSPQEFEVQTGQSDKHRVRIEPFDDI